MTKTLMCLFLLSTSFYFSSCKKNSENSKTTMQLMTQQTWKLSEESWNPNSAGWTDIYLGIPSCLRDNFDKYNSDLSFVADEGLTKCNILDPQNRLGTWQLYPSGTKYSISLNGQTIDYDILELSESVLKIYFKIVNAPSIVEYKATLIH